VTSLVAPDLSSTRSTRSSLGNSVSVQPIIYGWAVGVTHTGDPGLMDSRESTVPIAATYPIEKVREAYTELAKRHTRGKIVLRMR